MKVEHNVEIQTKFGTPLVITIVNDEGLKRQLVISTSDNESFDIDVSNARGAFVKGYIKGESSEDEEQQRYFFRGNAVFTLYCAELKAKCCVCGKKCIADSTCEGNMVCPDKYCAIHKEAE